MCNLDETCTKPLPNCEKGWLKKGQMLPGGSKPRITSVLATRPGHPGLLAQCIFDGKTMAVEPPNVHDCITTAHSESHWSTTATLVSFVDFIDQARFNTQEPPDTYAWVLLMDVSTVHISA